MARFLHEYAGTNWIGWLIIVCILSVPFFWEEAGIRAPVLYLQVLNFFFALFCGSFFGSEGNGAMGLAVWIGFGIGYSLLAFRKPSGFERIAGVVLLLFFGILSARIALHWR